MSAKIGSLAVSLSLDADNFNGSMAQVDRNLRTMGSELKATKALGADYGKSLGGLTSKKDILSRSLGAANIKLTETRKKYDEMVEGGKSSEAQLERQAKKVNDAQTAYNRLETELKEVEKALKVQSSSWTQLSQKLEPIGAKLKSVGDGMTSIGKDLSMKVTAPLVALGTGAFKAAVDFESAFAGVRKTVDMTEVEFNKLSGGIRSMSKEIPVAATEIAGVAEAAGQLGIKNEAILGFTRVMVDMGVATNMSSDQAATALARFANITQMSQQDFDRLGSTIVDLGNNLATTESEIVDMGLRLAGAGKQVGLSEAQIMSFAGALSSVGIEAEAGGSAFSKVMVNMQLATETGGKELENFAKVAGMSASDFKQAFEEDAATAMISFIAGLADAESQGMSAIGMLDEMGITEVRMRDSLLRAAGASDVFTESLEIGTKAWDENNALTNEAEERYKTTASQMKILWNQIVDIGISLGDILIPMVVELMDKLKPLIEGFANMSTETQKTILVIAGVAAAIGPILVIVGMLVSSIGTIVSAVSAMSAAIGLAGGAAGVFGGALAILTGPIGLTVAAIGTLVAGGVLLYKNWDKLVGDSPLLHAAIMGLTGPIGLIVGGIKLFQKATSDAIPEVNRFGDEVSDTTKDALGSFFKLSDGVGQSLAKMSITSSKVTGEMKDDIVSKYAEMNTQILEGMAARHEEEFAQMETMFLNTLALTDQEKEEILSKKQEGYEKEVEYMAYKEERINEILTEAANENRELTEREIQVIQNINEQAQEEAVKVLSESEMEQKIILERMKDSASDLSAEQAQVVIENSAKARNESVAEAEAQYDETYAAILRMRDETGELTEEQAAKMIAEATKTRDETVYHAEDMHSKVLEGAEEHSAGILRLVDEQTGETLSKWEVFKKDTTTKFEEMRKNVSEKWDGMKKDGAEKTKDLVVDAVKKFSEMKKGTTQAAKDMYTDVKGKFEDIRASASEKFEAAKKLIVDPIESARDKISEAVEKIKGFFSGLTLEIPSIKLPSLPSPKITGSFEFGPPPKVPKMTWNAKGGIFSKPTIFNTANAGLQGVGESGPEAILPLNSSVLGAIGKAIASTMNTGKSNQGQQSGEVVIYTTVINEINGREVSREIHEDVTYFQNQDKKWGDAF